MKPDGSSYSRQFLSVFFCLIFSCLAGCSELIPGLNVQMSGSGKHAYHVVQSPDGRNDLEVKAQGTQGVDYQIIPVDAKVLFELRNEAQDDFVASAVALPSILPSDIPSEYPIGAADVIYVTVWEHPELSPFGPAAINDPNVQAIEGRMVAADGTMYFPYVGSIKVSGLTATALRDRLTRDLSKFIVSPRVDVRVVAYRAKRIEVTGEVIKPGTITLDDTPKGVLQAIDAAGGLTALASRRNLTLIRANRVYPIDLAGLLSGNRLVPNTALMNGDVIHVPDQSADQIFVLGAVNKQQPVIMTEDPITLIQALTSVGGLDALKGKQSGIFVFHMHQARSGINASVYAIDMSRPDGILIASQFPLRTRDIVYVEATEFSKYNSVITELLPTVTTVFELSELKNLSK